MEKEGINVRKTIAEERWNKRNARAYERYLKITPNDVHQLIARGIEVAR